MSLLRNQQPVNPLNRAAPEQALDTETSSYVQHEELPAETPQHVAMQQADQAYEVVPAQSRLPVQASAPAQFDDGLGDDVELGFGALPRVKLDKGFFWLDDQRMGEEFECHIFQKRDQYVYHNKKGNDAQVAWSYEDIDKNPNAVTTKGEPLAAVLNRWKAEGHDTPRKNLTYEVAAMIIGGEYDGAVVMLSVPSASTKKFDGYKKVTSLTKGLRLNQIVTKAKIGPIIKVDDGTFQPWVFEYARPYQA
jgi:hypothetical protein